MANVDLANGLSTGLQPTPKGKAQPYIISTNIDWAAALAMKGSALAAGDVVFAIDVPAGTVVLSAGLQQIVPANATTLTLHVGTTVDNDAYVASFDAVASVANTYAQKPLAGSETVIGTTPGTVDIVLNTLTGTLTTGKVRVWALLCDVAAPPSPTLPALGS